MTHISPAAVLLWAVLSVLLLAFLIYHLWKFDKFKCLKWNAGQTGAFKRVMTYSYITSVPLLTVFGVLLAIVKYKVGYTLIPGFGIVPTPYILWPAPYQDWLTLLYILFAVAWALEMVSHLEELQFWLFLLHQDASRLDWFRSYHFKTWVLGSLSALIGMPLVVVFTRKNPLNCEAWTFLVGSCGSLIITVWFLRVLWLFPTFLRRIKAEGANGEVVVRLNTYHELNVIRVVFRFIWVLSFLTLGLDGVIPHRHEVNESALATDMLAILASIGCIVSSAITLLVFFPRSIAQEAGYKAQQKTTIHSIGPASTQHSVISRSHHYMDSLSPSRTRSTSAPVTMMSKSQSNSSFIDLERDPRYLHGHRLVLTTSTRGRPRTAIPPGSTPQDIGESESPISIQLQEAGGDRKEPNTAEEEEEEDPSKVAESSQLGGSSGTGGDQSTIEKRLRYLEAAEGAKKRGRNSVPSTLHPYILSYTSPIDLVDSY